MSDFCRNQENKSSRSSQFNSRVAKALQLWITEYCDLAIHRSIVSCIDPVWSSHCCLRKVFRLAVINVNYSKTTARTNVLEVLAWSLNALSCSVNGQQFFWVFVNLRSSFRLFVNIIYINKGAYSFLDIFKAKVSILGTTLGVWSFLNLTTLFGTNWRERSWSFWGFLKEFKVIKTIWGCYSICNMAHHDRFAATIARPYNGYQIDIQSLLQTRRNRCTLCLDHGKVIVSG